MICVFSKRITVKNSDTKGEREMIPQVWKENKPKIMRRGIFFLLVLVAGVLQISDVLPTFFGIKFLPLLPLTVVLGMFERETYGLYYGLMAGILWDMNVGPGDGFNAFFFSLVGFSCGLLMTYLMMNNLITATILCSFWTIVYFVVTWLIFVVAKSSDGSAGILLVEYLPTAIINILMLPFYYYAVRSVMKQFRLMENDEISF